MNTSWYEYPTNYSNGTTVEGLGSFVQYAGTVVGDYLGAGIILIIWMAVFGVSMMAGSKKAILVASFISAVFSIYFVRLEMIHPTIVMLLIVVTAISFVFVGKDTSL